MQLFHIVHEEEPVVHHDLVHKVVVEEILVPCKEGDAVLEDDAVVDGTVVAKVAQVMLLRPKLARSVITVASTDIMLRNVRRAQAHPAVAILPSL